MVTEVDLQISEASWRQQLRECFTSVAALCEAGLMSATEAAAAGATMEQYQLRIPRYYADLFDRASPQTCPIRRQALASIAEKDPVWPTWAQGWSREAFGRNVPWMADAIGDLAKQAAPRLTHRYHNRAIMHVSATCSMYCRFCFRKSHINDAERLLYRGDLAPALAYIQATPSIREVVLTGGDPLSLTDASLGRLLDALSAIEHVRTVRIHSRMVVTLPARLTPALAELLGRQRATVALVAHFNHPRELTARALDALHMMRRHGVTLYNQSVLLRDVNDQVEILYDLFQQLYEQGTTPYYLHHPDWTPGTFHFRTSIERGRQLVRALEGRLSGPAMPRYVLDIPGGSGKVSLLGERVTAVRQHTADGIGGAIYEIEPPNTREPGHRQGRHIYADFWSTGQN